MKAPIIKSALLIAVSALFFSCQKDVSGLPTNSQDSKAGTEKVKYEHKIRAEFNGTSYVLPLGTELYFYGTTEGWSTGLGKFQTFFINRLDPSNPFASITLNPLFQASMDDLEFLNGKDLTNVSVISYDKQGNSIWGQIVSMDSNSSITPPEGMLPSTVLYTIVGGTGKYEGATGTYTITGYYEDPLIGTPPYDMYYELSGVISFKDVE